MKFHFNVNMFMRLRFVVVVVAFFYLLYFFYDLVQCAFCYLYISLPVNLIVSLCAFLNLRIQVSNEHCEQSIAKHR